MGNKLTRRRFSPYLTNNSIYNNTINRSKICISYAETHYKNLVILITRHVFIICPFPDGYFNLQKWGVNIEKNTLLGLFSFYSIKTRTNIDFCPDKILENDWETGRKKTGKLSLFEKGQLIFGSYLNRVKVFETVTNR